ncbi:MAG: hypothetical protein E3K36_09110 [Candidatus Brocadia sp.]|nr:hypothetical protein [Candidatus Brocadia sp.]
MLLNHIKRVITNIPGWRTNRKIVVIESDDWGSVRIPSKSIYSKLLKAGIPVDKDPYCKFDSLETAEDIYSIFDILSKYKDKNGTHPVITVNTVMSNPDFKKIKDSKFQKYYYLPSLNPNGSSSHDTIKLFNEGISNHLFFPQFHGREHLNTKQWLLALQNGDNETHIAFEYGVYGIPLKNKVLGRRNDFMAALDINSYDDVPYLSDSIKEGSILFEKRFNYRSKSFVAPCYTWSSELEIKLREAGIFYIQGIHFQNEPIPGKCEYKRRLHYIGQKNRHGQIYLIRNCSFEPTITQNTGIVDECLKRINLLFKLGKPVIIGTHRLNYTGTLHVENRINNLMILDKLLKQILKLWPDTEFMNTCQLGELIKNKS